MRGRYIRVEMCATQIYPPNSTDLFIVTAAIMGFSVAFSQKVKCLLTNVTAVHKFTVLYMFCKLLWQRF